MGKDFSFSHYGLPPPPPPPPPPPSGGGTTTTPMTREAQFVYGSLDYARPPSSFIPPPGSSPLPPSCANKNNNGNTETASSHLYRGNETSFRNGRRGKGNTNEENDDDNKSATWRCDACEIMLDSQQAFKAHVKSHVRCSDCSFEGSRKVVKRHFELQHGRFKGTGFKSVTIQIPGCRIQKFKICVGNRPEDIQKWISERKKRFPRLKSTTTLTRDNTSLSNNNGDNCNRNGMKEKQKESTSLTKTTITAKSEPAIGGISLLLAGYGSSSSESDDSENDEPENAALGVGAEKNENMQLLSSVIEAKSVSSNTTLGAVTTMAEETVTETKSDSINKKKDTVLTATATATAKHCIDQPNKNRPCRYFMRNDGRCLHGNNCRYSHDPSLLQQHAAPINNTNRKRKRGCAGNGPTTADNLLRKLLQTDMERETALTMKLLKYIVDSNFLKNDTTS